MRCWPHRREPVRAFIIGFSELRANYTHIYPRAKLCHCSKVVLRIAGVTSPGIVAAVQNSIGCAWQPNQSAMSRPASSKWPRPNRERCEAIIADGYGLAELWELSNPRIDDNKPHTEEIIDQLFPRDALLCCAKSNSVFDTKPHEDWRGDLAK